MAPRHLVCGAEGTLEADRIGAAMALDDNAIEPEEHTAIDVARVELAAKRVERLSCNEGTQHREDIGAKGRADVRTNLASGPLGGLERDITGKAFGDDHIDRALADVIAFDE